MKKLKRHTSYYLLAETFLYILVMIALFMAESENILTSNVNFLKFASILLCLLFTLIYNQNNKLMIIASSLTVLAQLTFTILHQYQSIGMLMYCIVNVLYAYRIYQYHNFQDIFYRIGVFTILFVGLWCYKALTPLTFFACFCYTNVIYNCWDNAKIYSKNINTKLSLLGFLLLLLANSFLLIGSIEHYASISRFETLRAIAPTLNWLMFIPSQVLITLSGHEDLSYGKK